MRSDPIRGILIGSDQIRSDLILRYPRSDPIFYTICIAALDRASGRATCALQRTEKHLRDTSGGGLEPAAANPGYWDQVPYSETIRPMRARLPGGRRSSCAQLNILREEPPQRAQIEQAEAAKIADSPAH